MSKCASISPYSDLSYPEEVEGTNLTYTLPSPINYDRVASADDIKFTTMPRVPAFSSTFEAHGLTVGGVPPASNVAHSTAGLTLTNIESRGVEEGQLILGHSGAP